MSCCRTRCQTWCWGMYGDDKDFFTLKGVVENLLDTLAIREYDVDAKSDDPTFHPGRCAVLSKDGEEFGIIGRFIRWFAQTMASIARVYVGKLKLRKLFAMMDTQRSYVPMPKFPASTRDLALLCDDALPAMTMEKAIKAAAGKILEKIELFDVYKGSQIAQGKKSVAFNIRYACFRPYPHRRGGQRRDEQNPQGTRGAGRTDSFLM